MKAVRCMLFLVTALLLLPLQAFSAESPLERAQKIKEWRTNCNDPDPDLRVAYLETAIATRDQTVIRTCVKQTLSSDNDDVRNLAIRAGLASAERLALEFSHGETYLNAIERAGTNAAEIKRVEAVHKNEIWALKQNSGIVSLAPIDVSVTSQTSRWYALGTFTAASDRHVAELTLVGDKLTGTGNTKYGNYAVNFTLSLVLDENGTMVGKGTLYNDATLPVTLKLY